MKDDQNGGMDLPAYNVTGDTWRITEGEPVKLNKFEEKFVVV